MAGAIHNTEKPLSSSAVIFDWDDTLVASTADQYKSLHNAFRQFDTQAPFAGSLNTQAWLDDKFTLEAFTFLKCHGDPKYSLWPNIIGFMLETHANVNYGSINKNDLIKNAGDEKKDKEELIAERILDIYTPDRQKTSEHPTLFAGAESNLLALADKGIPIGIVSTKSQKTLFNAANNVLNTDALQKRFQLVALDEYGEYDATKLDPHKKPIFVSGGSEAKGLPRKPDPIQYLQMIKAMNALGAGGNVWSIGDLPNNDITPLQKFGCNGIVFGKQLSREEVDASVPEGYKEKIVYGATSEVALKANDHHALAGHIANMERAPVLQHEFPQRNMHAIKESLIVPEAVTGELLNASSSLAKTREIAVNGKLNGVSYAMGKRVDAAIKIAEHTLTAEMIDSMAEALCRDGKSSPVHITFSDPMHPEGGGNVLTVIGAHVLQEKLLHALKARGREDVRVTVDSSIHSITVPASAENPPIAHRPLFKGNVNRHARYIVWSDQIKSGADVADLANHIIGQGGNVELIAGLTRYSPEAGKLFQTPQAHEALYNAIRDDAEHMLTTSRKNMGLPRQDIPPITPQELDKQTDRLMRYLDTALERVGLSIETLTQAQTVALTQDIKRLKPSHKGQEPQRVFGAVNDILGELMNAMSHIDKEKPGNFSGKLSAERSQPTLQGGRSV